MDLTISNPTRAGLVYPDRQLLAALSQPGGLRYSPAAQGLESARTSVANYYLGRGAQIDPSRILLTASTSEAYAYLFKLLADSAANESKDEILAPRPSYPLLEFLARLEGVQLRQYPLRYDGAWHIDFPALEKSITARTRAVVVVNPNNPTGSFISPDEWDRLQNLAAANQLAILSDEVFSDYVFAHGNGNSLSPLAREPRCLTFSLSGLSKIAGLPQLKLGWIVAGGPGHSGAIDALSLIADTFLSVASPVQVALPELLDLAGGIQQQIRQRTAANLDHLTQALSGSNASVLNTQGGWYAVLQVPSTKPDEQWAMDLLEQHDVLVQPGYFYDFESEAYLVVSLLTPTETFQLGISRLRAAV